MPNTAIEIKIFYLSIMNGYVLDLHLEKTLISLGGFRTYRAIHYNDIIIHENYLDSKESVIRYCSFIAFDTSRDRKKRVSALKLSTFLLNNYSK